MTYNWHASSKLCRVHHGQGWHGQKKVYPVAKIALVVDALREGGVAPDEALQGAHVSAAEHALVLYGVSRSVVQTRRGAQRSAQALPSSAWP
jgi:hypothetical protein